MLRAPGVPGSLSARRNPSDPPVALLVLLGAAFQKQVPFVPFVLLLSVLPHRTLVLVAPLLRGALLLPVRT
jgi:hypothetical protein